MNWENIYFNAKGITERAELIADETKSEEDKFSKNLINDWIFEIEGFIEEIREDVKE